nr:hypothetical protein [Streptomyces sp. SID8382]
MDAQGIDVSVLALTPPGVQPLLPREALTLSRAANDMAAAAVARHPDRFRSLSTLPMSSPKDVAGELERAAGMGHVGTMVYGRSGDLFLDDPPMTTSSPPRRNSASPCSSIRSCPRPQSETPHIADSTP